MNLKQRIAVVFDGKKWYGRRIREIEHDLNRDEMVYRCDAPIAELNGLESFNDVCCVITGCDGG